MAVDARRDSVTDHFASCGCMTIEMLIAKYGLFALFVGSGLEGEMVVVTGGVLAHQGLVPLWGAMLVSAMGSCLADQLWFFIGRYFRHYRWVQTMMERAAFARAKGLLERYPVAFIFGFRFIYGLRTISPIAIGATHVETRKFVPINIVAAAVWGPMFTLLGYAFGRAIDPLLHRLQESMTSAILVAAGVASLALGGLWLVRRHRAKAAAETASDTP